MTNSVATLNRTEAMRPAGRPVRLIDRIYRDVGLAAVARELELSADDLEPELSEAVKRGSRYIYLTPKADYDRKAR
jgi:hypothetical protein